MTETKQHTNREHIDFFQSRLDTLSPETAVKYRRTISELDLFLTHHSLQLADLNPTMTADWACHLLRKGLSKSTVTRHLNILSTLAHSSARQGLTTSTDAPRALARRSPTPHSHPSSTNTHSSSASTGCATQSHTHQQPHTPATTYSSTHSSTAPSTSTAQPPSAKKTSVSKPSTKPHATSSNATYTPHGSTSSTSANPTAHHARYAPK